MPPALTFTVIGIPKMRQRLSTIRQAWTRDLARAMYLEGQIELAEMKKRTPFKYGSLRKSGRIDPPAVIVGRNMTMRVSFGGGDLDYAIPVHERTWVWHKYGEAKWVTNVLNEVRPYFIRRVLRRAGLGQAL